MAVSVSGPVADWRIRGSSFEAYSCQAICPCRSVGGRPGGPSSFGECFGALVHVDRRARIALEHTAARKHAAFTSDFDYRSDAA
jgi:hypothetical protein